MRKAPHILYLCADRGVRIGGRKGASAHVAELTRALRRRGAEVRILAMRVEEDVGPDQLPAPVIELASSRTARSVRDLLFADARTERQHARTSETFGLVLNQLIAAELDRLHRDWRIDAVYERYSLWSYAAAAFTRTHRIPHLLEVNSPLRQEQQRYRTLDNPAAAADLESYLLRGASHVIVPASALRCYAIVRGARPASVRVMPNAADPELFHRNGRARPPEGNGFVIGFLGTLKPWHGVEDLVRAFRHLHRRHSGYRLLIAGDGPLRSSLERALRQHGLQRAATFTGEVEHRQVPELLGRMDVGTAPYPHLPRFYFSPLKIFEYMAAGVPVVASDIGQIREVLRHERTALLHGPGRIRSLAACIETLRLQPRLAAHLAAEARRLQRTRFTWDGNARRVLRLIEDDRRRGKGRHR